MLECAYCLVYRAQREIAKVGLVKYSQTSANIGDNSTVDPEARLL